MYSTKRRRSSRRVSPRRSRSESARIITDSDGVEYELVPRRKSFDRRSSTSADVESVSPMETKQNLSQLAGATMADWVTMSAQPKKAERMSHKSRSSSSKSSKQIFIPSSLEGILSDGGSHLGQNLSGIVQGFGQNFLSLGDLALPTGDVTTEIENIVSHIKVDFDNLDIKKNGRVNLDHILSKAVQNESNLSSKPFSDMKSEFLQFSDNINIDRNAEALHPKFGEITVQIPTRGSYPSPLHYLHAMKILSLSEMSFGHNVDTSPCDIARKNVAALATQPHAEIIEAMSAKCDTKITTRKWFSMASEDTKFFYYLFIAMWCKYAQNRKYADALRSTGSKYLFEKDAETLNLYGVYLMIIRGLLAAGWVTYKSGSVNPAGVFHKWVLPLISKIYSENSAKDMYELQ